MHTESLMADWSIQSLCHPEPEVETENKPQNEARSMKQNKKGTIRKDGVLFASRGVETRFPSTVAAVATAVAAWSDR
jgi:hypothetical protein